MLRGIHVRCRLTSAFSPNSFWKTPKVPGPHTSCVRSLSARTQMFCPGLTSRESEWFDMIFSVMVIALFTWQSGARRRVGRGLVEPACPCRTSHPSRNGRGVQIGGMSYFIQLTRPGRCTDVRGAVGVATALARDDILTARAFGTAPQHPAGLAWEIPCIVPTNEAYSNVSGNSIASRKLVASRRLEAGLQEVRQ